MRYLLFLTLPLALAGQSAGSDQQVIQSLLSEVHELRLAIERSTLLNARTQLAISQLQMQEAAVARLSTQLNDTRSGSMARRIAMFTEQIKEREEKRTSPDYSAPPKRELLEQEIRNMKQELEQAQSIELQRAAREGELAAQLQGAQNQVADSRSRIAEMERALDAAIQQLLKRP